MAQNHCPHSRATCSRRRPRGARHRSVTRRPRSRPHLLGLRGQPLDSQARSSWGNCFEDLVVQGVGVSSLGDHLDPAIRDHLKTGIVRSASYASNRALAADARAAIGSQVASRASELRSSLARPWTPPAPRRPSANIAARREPGCADHAARNLGNLYGRIRARRDRDRIENRIDPVSIWWSPGQIAASK